MLHTVTVLLCGFFVSFALLFAIIFTEMRLAKSQYRWPGLILPILSFLLSLAMILGNILYVGGNVGLVVASAILGLAWANIPTYILLTIYVIVRHRLKCKKQLSIMNIHDLQ